jgi:hypothetical protein
MASVFHLELRQFPHTARRFNLAQAQLHGRFLGAWVRGQVVELDSQHFEPGRAKISIYEGRQLATTELGLGRGWQNASRTGTDVTERELEAARSQARGATGPAAPTAAQPLAATVTTATLAGLKAELAALSEVAPVGVSQALVLATGANPTARVSERLAIAERVVAELLGEGRVQMFRAGAAEPVQPMDWGPLLLAWATWTDSPPSVLLKAIG